MRGARYGQDGPFYLVNEVSKGGWEVGGGPLTHVGIFGDGKVGEW